MIDGFEVVEDKDAMKLRGNKYRCADVIGEFLDCDAECIVKDYGDDVSARKAVMSFRQYLAANPSGIKVAKRGTRMFLAKL